MSEEHSLRLHRRMNEGGTVEAKGKAQKFPQIHKPFTLLFIHFKIAFLFIPSLTLLLFLLPFHSHLFLSPVILSSQNHPLLQVEMVERERG